MPQGFAFASLFDDGRKDADVGFRPRVSLLTVMLLLTIAGLGVGLWQAGREVAPLRAEVRRLRAEVGELSIDDPERIYVLPLDDDALERHTWKWRIFLPQVQVYAVHVATMRIPEIGDVAPNCSSTIRGGEYVLTIGLRKQRDGRWAVVTRWKETKGGSPQGTFGSICGINPTSDWLDKERGVQTSGVIGAGQDSFDAGRPVELLRLRAMDFTPQYPQSDDPIYEHVGTSRPSVGPADGFLLWIEEHQPDAPP